MLARILCATQRLECSQCSCIIWLLGTTIPQTQQTYKAFWKVFFGLYLLYSHPSTTSHTWWVQYVTDVYLCVWREGHGARAYVISNNIPCLPFGHHCWCSIDDSKSTTWKIINTSGNGITTKRTCQFLVVTMKLRRQLLLLIAVLLSLLCAAQSISFSLDPDVRKCIQEEVHKDVLVVGEYKLSDQNGQKTDILVWPCEYLCV